MTLSDTECVALMRKLYAPQPGDFDHIEDPGQDDAVPVTPPLPMPRRGATAA
jgi:hypothetical protein